MSSPTQTLEFSQYVGTVLEEMRDAMVVEVGTDDALRLAGVLGKSCREYVAVTLPGAYDRAEFSYDMLGGNLTNIKLLAHNALRLSEVVPQADLVIVHNVLLEPKDGDAMRKMQIIRGEVPCTDEEWEAILARFTEAEKQGFREFSNVAADGMVIDFRRQAPAGKPSFAEFLVAESIASDERVTSFPLLYDDGIARDESWVATIIDNIS